MLLDRHLLQPNPTAVAVSASARRPPPCADVTAEAVSGTMLAERRGPLQVKQWWHGHSRQHGPFHGAL